MNGMERMGCITTCTTAIGREYVLTVATDACITIFVLCPRVCYLLIIRLMMHLFSSLLFSSLLFYSILFYSILLFCPNTPVLLSDMSEDGMGWDEIQ